MLKRIFASMMLLSLALVALALPAIAQDGENACIVTSIEGAVTRGGPGTNFEQRAPIATGDSETAVAFEDGLEGFRWWQLTDGRWVREDLVTESAGCETVDAPELPTGADEDTCVVTSIAGAVTRTGPNTDAERAGPLARNETAIATDREEDAGGQTWWQLDDDRWVREDLVTESEACDTLGVVAPPDEDDVAGEACVIRVINGAVTRAQPSTEAEQRAPLAAGETLTPVDSEPDALGQLWWQLDDGRWVREDLVFESSGCETLGEPMAMDDVPEDVCVVTSIEGAVTRTGPDVSFERGAPLPQGESAVAVDSEPDAGGQLWYRLASGVWVREDLVSESDACADVDEPEVAFTDDVCFVQAINGAVTRTGPGTNFERRAPLPAGDAVLVAGSELDINGQLWWELDDGRWVREDLVSESDACEL